MRRVRAALLAALIAAAAIGCASNGSGKPPSAKKSPVKPFVLSRAQIPKALLTIRDMPKGYSIDRSRDTSADTSPSGCRELDALSLKVKPAKGAPHAAIAFTGGTFGPFISEDLTVHPAGKGREYMAAYAAGFQKCGSFTSKEDDGTVTHWTMAPLSTEDYGDETTAARLTGTTQIGPFVAEIVVVRRGQLMMTVSTAGIGTAPASAPIVKKAWDHIGQV